MWRYQNVVSDLEQEEEIARKLIREAQVKGGVYFLAGEGQQWIFCMHYRMATMLNDYFYASFGGDI